MHPKQFRDHTGRPWEFEADDPALANLWAAIRVEALHNTDALITRLNDSEKRAELLGMVATNLRGGAGSDDDLLCAWLRCENCGTAVIAMLDAVAAVNPTDVALLTALGKIEAHVIDPPAGGGNADHEPTTSEAGQSLEARSTLAAFDRVFGVARRPDLEAAIRAN